MTGILASPAGFAFPLMSGGYLLDFGDATPRFAPDRDHARAELVARAEAARTLPRATPYARRADSAISSRASGEAPTTSPPQSGVGAGADLISPRGEVAGPLASVRAVGGPAAHGSG